MLIQQISTSVKNQVSCVNKTALTLMEVTTASAIKAMFLKKTIPAVLVSYKLYIHTHIYIILVILYYMHASSYVAMYSYLQFYEHGYVAVYCRYK